MKRTFVLICVYIFITSCFVSFLLTKLLIQIKVDSNGYLNSEHSMVGEVFCKCGWSINNNLYLSFLVKYRHSVKTIITEFHVQRSGLFKIDSYCN